MDLIVKEVSAGIDISKEKFNVAIRNRDTFIAEEEFENDTGGASQCYQLLITHDCKEVVMESTGAYWYGPYDYLDSRGIDVTLVNPAKAKSYLLLNKSDRIDARVLATLHMLGRVKASYVPPQEIRRLRRMTRFRAKLIDMRTQLKNTANSSISAYSGSLTSIFSDLFGLTAREVLDAISSTLTPDVKQADDSERQDAILKALNGTKRRLSEEKKTAILDAVSKAYTPSLDSWIVKFTSDAIEQVQSWIGVLSDAIAKAVESIPRVKEYVERLLTIRGVGLETAQAIAAEIADITRFEWDGALIRYAGINPKIEQSGKVRRYGKLEKGGPRWLRRALYQAASVMAFKGPQNFQNHYGAVKERYGTKGHGVAVVSTARKLTRLVWAMLTDGTDYIDSPRALTERKRKELSRRARRYDSSSEEKRPSLYDLFLNFDRLPSDVKQMLAEL